MKKRKIFITLLVFCVLILTCATKSFAANSFSVNMTPSSTRVPKGEEFEVTVKLSKISVDGGIAAMRAVLKFDKDVVSFVEANGINGWSGKYNDENDSILFDNASAVKADTEIGKIKFRMSNSTSATTAAIRLVSIEGGNASLADTIQIADITTNVTVGGGGSSPTAPTTIPTGSDATNTNATVLPTTKVTPTPNTQTPSDTSNNTSKITPPVVNTPSPLPVNNTPKNTTTNDNIPKTGTEGYVIPLMAFIAVLSIISFVNYKKLNEK